MADQEKLNAAVELFTKNPFYKEKLDGAPSKECREYIALGFYWSAFIDADDYQADKKRLEDAMTVEDWEYLLKYTGNDPMHAFITNKIKALRNTT